jgi:hypothetical protein
MSAVARALRITAFLLFLFTIHCSLLTLPAEGQTTTPWLGMTVPAPVLGAQPWANELNADLYIIDSAVGKLQAVSYPVGTLTATPTFNFTSGSMQSGTLGANVTSITLSNPGPAPYAAFLQFYQSAGSGPYTLAGWPGDVLWDQSGGVAPTMPTAAGGLLTVLLIWDGTQYHGNWNSGGNVARSPGSSTNGDMACWNGTSGMLLEDCGAVPTSFPGFGSATPGMDGTGSAGSATTAAHSDHTHPSDTTRALIVASGTLALATSSISSGACQAVTAGSVNSAAASGVLATDTIKWNPNASIKAVTGYAPGVGGGLSIAPYPTAGYVNFDVCNWTSTPISPGAVTLNYEVTR